MIEPIIIETAAVLFVIMYLGAVSVYFKYRAKRVSEQRED